MATKRIVYLDEAADVLGLSQEALRKRITRGTMQAQKDAAGRWQVFIEDDVQDGGGGRGQAEKDALIKVLNAQIDELREDKAFLKEELKQRTEELGYSNMKRFQTENEIKQLENKLRLLLEAPKPKRWWPFS